ncbi:MAG: c-type cytochrome [Gammaproteobacteria bacterium]|nr:c-type cytochrome [Gammaproteobacteria bacterium]
MSEAQDETFSPHNITVLGGLLLIAIIIGEVVIGQHGDEEMAVEPVDTMEDMAMRLQPVISLDQMRSSMTVASAAADVADKSPDQLYQSACLACHSTGAAGAPKIGDAAAWTTRLAKGVDALVTSAINGIGAMPARGGSQFSDEQVRATVEYILAESK